MTSPTCEQNHIMSYLNVGPPRHSLRINLTHNMKLFLTTIALSSIAYSISYILEKRDPPYCDGARGPVQGNLWVLWDRLMLHQFDYLHGLSKRRTQHWLWHLVDGILLLYMERLWMELRRVRDARSIGSKFIHDKIKARVKLGKWTAFMHENRFGWTIVIWCKNIFLHSSLLWTIPMKVVKCFLNQESCAIEKTNFAKFLAFTV